MKATAGILEYADNSEFDSSGTDTEPRFNNLIVKLYEIDDPINDPDNRSIHAYPVACQTA